MIPVNRYHADIRKQLGDTDSSCGIVKLLSVNDLAQAARVRMTSGTIFACECPGTIPPLFSRFGAGRDKGKPRATVGRKALGLRRHFSGRDG